MLMLFTKQFMEKNKNAQALGSIKSKRKSITSRLNGLNSRSGIIKTEFFKKLYPYPLTSNEWIFKFDLGMKTPTGKRMTYNPDFFCKKTGYYIEVATSKGNKSSQGWKWKRSIARGLKLKVFWWEGEEITSNYL